MVAAKESVLKFLEIGFKEPNEILEKFRKYQFLFERSASKVTKSLFPESGPTPEGLNEQLDQIAEAMRTVGSLCINEKNTHFFQVRTQNIKENIFKKATDISNHILVKTVDHCQKMIEDVQNGYEKMSQRLQGDVNDEKELVILKEEIANHEKNIGHYQNEIARITEFLNILEKNNYKFP